MVIGDVVGDGIIYYVGHSGKKFLHYFKISEEKIEKVKDSAYKIIGSVMVLTKKDELKKDLFSKKEILELRIKNLEKQEQKIKEKSQEIQKEVAKEIK